MAQVISSVFPIIAGDSTFSSGENLIFNNIEPLTDGSITDTKPDLYDGTRPDQLDRRVRAAIGPYITPSTIADALILSNFFVEAKVSKGGRMCQNVKLYKMAHLVLAPCFMLARTLAPHRITVMPIPLHPHTTAVRGL